MSERTDKLESGLDQKIVNKVSQMLHKRLITEVGRIKKDIESKLAEIKSDTQAEVSSELDALNERISSFAIAINSEPNDTKCNIVIRNLPESNNEITLQ